jgi:hypothetical protein
MAIVHPVQTHLLLDDRYRSAQTVIVFMPDLAKRLSNRVQLTTNGHRAYVDAVDQAALGEKHAVHPLYLISETILMQRHPQPHKLHRGLKSRRKRRWHR